jgi:hypothetical protein
LTTGFLIKPILIAMGGIAIAAAMMNSVARISKRMMRRKRSSSL